MSDRFSEQAFAPIDEEEQLLIASLESDEWSPTTNPEQEKEALQTAARHTIRKDKRINLRLTEKDYYEIQVKAIEEGIPYQTLIASLVHKYLNGRLQVID